MATFSLKVKDEILVGLRDTPSCCRAACLSAFLRGAGSLSLFPSVGCSISSENKKLIEFARDILKTDFGKDVETEEEILLKKKVLYSVFADGQDLLVRCGLLKEQSDGAIMLTDAIFHDALKRECCEKAYVSALFAASGSITVRNLEKIDAQKNRVGYHLEFFLSQEGAAKELAQLLNKKGFSFKVAERRGTFAVYLKNSQLICDMLAYMGAGKALFELNNLIIEREIRNTANRQRNCITANIDKTLLASEKQIAAINKIVEKGMLDRLSRPLRQVAEERLEHPDATLDELAVICKISKSCINHRLRKLTDTAEKLM